MYPGKAYSPHTTLVQAISADTTEIEVADASALPPAPNIAVIGTNENAETIIYTEKTGNLLSGLIRGVECPDEARAWNAGALIARNIAKLDLDAIQENILKLAIIAGDVDGHVANVDIHVTAAWMQEIMSIISELMAFSQRSDIFITQAERDAWNAAAQTAAQALSIALENAGTVADMRSRLSQIEDSLFNAIIANPFIVTFGTLDGIAVPRGIWNETFHRVEC